MLFLLCLLYFFCGNCFADSKVNFQKVEIITIEEANYLTPENTLSARRSAFLSGNLDWADQCMTIDSLNEEIEDFEKAGINREMLFDLERNIETIFIVDRIKYLESIILITKAIGFDNSIQQIPFPFIKENNLWKFTNKFSEDEILLEYLHYIPPLFYGKGGRPMDVNTFLGYEQPTEAQTILADGDKSYVVHVYYGRTIDPSTFTAELNRENVSDLFSPEPLTDEEVEIPLQKGRNTLILSVEGTRKDGKKASDTDRLVFIVP